MYKTNDVTATTVDWIMDNYKYLYSKTTHFIKNSCRKDILLKVVGHLAVIS